MALATTVTACQTLRTRDAAKRPPTKPGEDRGQAFPSKEEPKKVALILGPGGAKAFAHVGVLKAFQEQKIPVEKIVGLEWGALIGGIYSSKAQVHDLEWKLYKMEQQKLPHKQGFFSKRGVGDESSKVMDGFLKESFGNQSFAQSKTPFSCPARSVWSGVVVWQDRGSLREGVKRCLPFPPVFKVQGSFVAGASQALEAVDALRKEGFNVIILVDVLGSALPVGQASLLDNLNYVILWQEIKRALNVASRFDVESVKVDTSAFPALQFEAKNDLIRLGEAAGQSAAAELISKYGF